MTVDRNDQDSAAEVVQFLIPGKANQKECLEFLANSIEIAHALAPDRWGVTLKEDLLRLNVGRIEVLAFYSGILRCILDLHTIPEKLEKLRIDETVYIFPDKNDPEAGFYKSVPGSVACNMYVTDTKKVLPLIQDSHRILVENASKTSRHTMTKGAHSPAVIDYLSSYLGRTIHQPEY
ncbi:MAG: hypothetical protein ABI904_22480 [Chloroflexota bacterium]